MSMFSIFASRVARCSGFSTFSACDHLRMRESALTSLLGGQRSFWHSECIPNGTRIPGWMHVVIGAECTQIQCWNARNIPPCEHTLRACTVGQQILHVPPCTYYSPVWWRCSLLEYLHNKASDRACHNYFSDGFHMNEKTLCVNLYEIRGIVL